MEKIIVIAHQKGGVGKSTIASNLATELDKKYKLKVVDLDLQKSLTYYNNLRGSAGLKTLDIIEVESASDLKKLINSNKSLLVIDVGGYDSDINRLAISGADLLITPVSDSGVELIGLLAFRKTLRDIRGTRTDLRAKVLLNRVHSRAGEASLNEIYNFIDNNVEFEKLNTILRDRVDYKRAFDEGKSVIEYNSKATNEIDNLINEVISNG